MESRTPDQWRRRVPWNILEFNFPASGAKIYSLIDPYNSAPAEGESGYDIFTRIAIC
jgi:hypothetical protein